MEHAIAGAVASSVAEVCTMPVDTAKVRLQLNREGYGRMLPTIRNIVRNEGARTLWRGASAAVARQGNYSALSFYGFNGCGIPRDTYAQKLLLGGTVGAMSVACVNPLDVVKVRIQSGSYSYSGVMQGLGSVVRNEGFRGMFAGVSPAMQRAFAVNAAELGTYAQAKEFFTVHAAFLPGAMVHLCASLVAGLASVIASNPLDVAKTRLMASSSTGGQRSLAGCLMQAVREEGPAALYKGAIPNWLRKGPHCAIQFVLYEQIVSAISAAREQAAVRRTPVLGVQPALAGAE